ncbi:viroplasmin family protein [Bacillus smithii]|uniref:ribonuclease H1 domain-containing protein n=1 Tax=Bacillus smithii TaxID=1479 RepID=UPI003D1FEE7B
MSKYYAVKVGRKTGIFNSWEECKKQVDGYSGASYKSFSTIEEAENYLKFSSSSHNEHSKEGLKTIEVYVDGSYNDSVKRYSYGCIILDSKKTRLSGVGDNKENTLLRNVAGELLGVMEAIKWACNNNYERIKIYHDYEGISKWATGEWSATKEGTKEYIQFLKDFNKKIQIDFIKVKAHSGNKFNEEADMLAKKALEIFVSSRRELQDIKEGDQSIEFTLFRRIMKSNDGRKNLALFNIKEYEITEGKLLKVAREFWKNKGRKIKDIETIRVNVDIEQFKICWLIIGKDQKEYSFSICLD